MEREPLLISRRRFVAGSAALAGAAALGLAGCMKGYGPPPSPNRFIALSTAGLTTGVPMYVEFDTTPPGPGATPAPPVTAAPGTATPNPSGAGAHTAAAWLVREQDGSIVAFVPLCTHEQCLYTWDAPTARFACPCHPGRFDVEGAVTGGPPPRPLWRYVTRPAGTDIIEIGWADAS